MTIIVSTLLMTMLITAANAALSPNALVNPPNELQVEGSSTVYPISLSAEAAFEALTGKEVTLASIGSGAGLNNLREGLTDVAATSMIPSESYWNTAGLEDMRLVAVGQASIAIIVPNSNTWLTDASSSLIADIFRSVEQTPDSAPLYEYWDEVPGLTSAPHQLIQRYTFTMNHNAHDMFNTFFMTPAGYNTGDNPAYTYWLPSHNEINTGYTMNSAVANNPYAIGYLGMGFLPANPTIKGVSINGVAPLEQNVINGTYKNDAGSVISRWLWYATSGVPTKASAGALKAQFISFVKSNNAYVTDNGYITILRSDFVGGSNTPDTTAPLHKSMPDGKVNFNDIVYFVDAYIAYNGAGNPIDPYCDFNADLKIDFTDIVKFVDGYIASPH